MKKYLVGGAVRDSLLNNPIADSDWVIVGAKPQELLDLGYEQVGKDFPVFLHPETKEEYALARTERKSGKGYTGFICDFSQEITLEQDLLRRDLTINAIAMDEDKNLIDPYGGINDLNNRILRHVSLAFKEDPLRVLRVARFAARYHHQGFTIAPETLTLMREIVKAGEMAHLTAERVWKETEKALATQNPQVFFEVLKACDALVILFPELNNLFGVPQPEKWHPEIDTGIHTLLALQQSALLTDDLLVRFSVLCHDFGKGLTPKEQWPHHKNHGEKGIALVQQLCTRLKIPNQYQKIASLMCRYHDEVHCVTKLPTEALVLLLNGIDVWRNPDNLEKLILTSLADLRGRKGFENEPYPQAQYLKKIYSIAKSVAIKDIIQAGFQGKEIHDELLRRRINSIDEWKMTNI
ncbi:multifunctional CCA addition/repair protein [Orbus sturtevantii]|uniref:multifunctional CCA addition/repair protein n=1 Tax=Orbus sturtevantii TaxID=3074109 RepID=UPI00370D955E